MNRRERRAAAARKVKVRSKTVRLDQFDKEFDICVDGKVEKIVMVFANARGRAVVDDLWPDVKWSTDPIFAAAHDPDWLFTHVRVTKLQPHLEAEVPLERCTPDAVVFAVAIALSRMAEPERVAHFTGPPDAVKVKIYGTSFEHDPRSLFVEYVAPGAAVAGTA
jgi:hypothetical protein